MEDYRIYIMDWAGRHIEDFDTLRAACDADAIETARRRRDRQPAELWLGGRQVCTLPARRDASIWRLPMTLTAPLRASTFA